jgi:hypothetical protein
MTKVKAAIALVLSAGALFFSRAYNLAGFSVGYGIKVADQNQYNAPQIPHYEKATSRA